MRKRPKNIIAAVIAAVIILSVVIIFVVGAGEKQMDIANESVAFINLQVNPEIEIALDADGNVTEVVAKNDDAIDIIEGLDFSGIPAKEVIGQLLDLIYDKFELEKRDAINLLKISYYSDTVELSKEEVLEFIPEKYSRLFSITAETGRIAQRYSKSSNTPNVTTALTTVTPEMPVYTPTIAPTEAPLP